MIFSVWQRCRKISCSTASLMFDITCFSDDDVLADRNSCLVILVYIFFWWLVKLGPRWHSYWHRPLCMLPLKKQMLRFVSYFKIKCHSFPIEGFLYITDIYLFPDTWFANILSHFTNCSLTLLNTSFLVQKLFRCKQPHFLLWLLLPVILGSCPRQSWPVPMSGSFSLHF